MEILAEILLQVLWWLIEFLCELLLQAFGEIIAEQIGRTLVEPFRRRKPIHPWLAAIVYCSFGAIAGAISLWLLPTLFISTHWLRIVNLVLTPVISGLVMARLGTWRRGRDEKTIRLDTFAYGFLFAFSMALVRFSWAH
jgi:hypothetical protein